MNRRIFLNGSVRFRLTAVATIVVAFVLVLSSFAVVNIQRKQLTDSLDFSLTQRADTIEAALDGTTTPNLFNSDGEDGAVQVVAEDGRVFASTSNLANRTIANPILSGDDERIWTTRNLGLRDPAYRVISRVINATQGTAVLHVVSTLADIDESVRSLTTSLAVAMPMVLALLAALMWWLIGRTLHPVETIRKSVAAITTSDLNERVEVPDRDDEISKLGATMNEMLDRLAASSQRQRNFVADAAHELRTPLTRIRTEIEVDLAQRQTADPFATHRVVLEETTALQQLIDDLLLLARSDARQLVQPKGVIDLDDVVLKEVKQQRTNSTRVTIDAQQVSGAAVVADADQMTRVVRNLLSNAIRHAASTVVVSLTETEHSIELSVSDDGPGVPLSDRDRIFERFTRLDEARHQNDGGSGLGLAIVKDIVEHHNGTVSCSSNHPTGARIAVTIPHASRR